MKMTKLFNDLYATKIEPRDREVVIMFDNNETQYVVNEVIDGDPVIVKVAAPDDDS